MFTQRTPQVRTPIRKRFALLTGVITALALAAPVAPASAATHAVNPRTASVVHSGDRAVAVGPTLSGDVFNGGLVIVTSQSPVAVNTSEG